MSGVAVITGASAGIGVELARVFARHGHTLVLVARREAKLRALADEIAAAGRAAPVVLPLDLTRPDAAEPARGCAGGAGSSRSTSSTTPALAWSATRPRSTATSSSP